jgi:hypothetical protein
MRTEQGNMLISLHQVQAFLDRNADAFAGVVKTGARKRLDGAIGALKTHMMEQTGHTLAMQATTQTLHELRTVLLRDHMAPIARIARADLPRTPELAALRMPRGRPSTMRLAAAAKGMAKEAAAHAHIFVAAALPANFVEQLHATTDALVALAKEGTESRGLVKAATTGLTAKLSAGRKIVHVLDALVKKALKRDNPELLANWNVVKRVRRTRARGATTAAARALTVSTDTPAAPAPETPVAPAPRPPRPDRRIEP